MIHLNYVADNKENIDDNVYTVVADEMHYFDYNTNDASSISKALLEEYSSIDGNTKVSVSEIIHREGSNVTGVHYTNKYGEKIYETVWWIAYNFDREQEIELSCTTSNFTGEYIFQTYNIKNLSKNIISSGEFFFYGAYIEIYDENNNCLARNYNDYKFKLKVGEDDRPLLNTFEKKDLTDYYLEHFSEYKGYQNFKIKYYFNYLILCSEKNGVEYHYDDDILYIDRAKDGIIPENTFEGLTDFTFLHIFGVDVISDGAFKNCTSLKEVLIDNPFYSVSIGKKAFASCSSLESVYLENPGKGIKLIDERAFENCISLKRVNMSGVKEIGDSVLSGCNNVYLELFTLTGWYSLENGKKVYVEDIEQLLICYYLRTNPRIMKD